MEHEVVWKPLAITRDRLVQRTRIMDHGENVHHDTAANLIANQEI